MSPRTERIFQIKKAGHMDALAGLPPSNNPYRGREALWYLHGYAAAIDQRSGRRCGKSWARQVSTEMAIVAGQRVIYPQTDGSAVVHYFDFRTGQPYVEEVPNINAQYGVM